MAMTARIWRYASFLVRVDIAVSITVAAALLIWMAWH